MRSMLVPRSPAPPLVVMNSLRLVAFTALSSSPSHCVLPGFPG